MLLLSVPYRTQFDGSLWQSANCGPASLGSVLGAYGIGVSTQRLRDLTNQMQGSSGYRDGTALETLRAIARQYGLQTAGPNNSSAFGRWTTADVRRQVSNGWPVITLVRYRSLPWNSASNSQSLHYIVVVGTTSRGFFVHDVGAAGGGIGRYRVLSSADLERAWADAGYSGLGLAVGPQPGGLSLPIARLLGSEFLGRGPVVFAGNQAAAAGSLESAAPLPPELGAAVAAVDVAPLPPSLAPASPESEAWTSAPMASLSSTTPLSQVAKALAPRFSGAAADLTRLAPSLSDRWAHPLGWVPPSQMYVEPAQPSDLAMAQGASSDPALVLSAREGQTTNHSPSLFLVAFGLGATILLLKRRDEV